VGTDRPATILVVKEFCDLVLPLEYCSAVTLPGAGDGTLPVGLPFYTVPAHLIPFSLLHLPLLHLPPPVEWVVTTGFPFHFCIYPVGWVEDTVSFSSFGTCRLPPLGWVAVLRVVPLDAAAFLCIQSLPYWNSASISFHWVIFSVACHHLGDYHREEPITAF